MSANLKVHSHWRSFVTVLQRRYPSFLGRYPPTPAKAGTSSSKVNTPRPRKVAPPKVGTPSQSRYLSSQGRYPLPRRSRYPSPSRRQSNTVSTCYAASGMSLGGLSCPSYSVFSVWTVCTEWGWWLRMPWSDGCFLCCRFEPFVPNEDDDYACHEVTAVFCVSSFQYITLAIVFSKGAPYRSTIFTNCKYQ